MEKLISDRLNDMNKQIENVENRQDKKWTEHLQFHRDMIKTGVQSRQFILGIVGLGLLDICVAIVLHFL